MPLMFVNHRTFTCGYCSFCTLVRRTQVANNFSELVWSWGPSVANMWKVWFDRQVRLPTSESTWTSPPQPVLISVGVVGVLAALYGARVSTRFAVLCCAVLCYCAALWYWVVLHIMQDSFESLMDNVEIQVGQQWHQAPGAITNTDMMTIGRGGYPVPKMTLLSKFFSACPEPVLAKHCFRWKS
jgi:hypothetical protein